MTPEAADKPLDDNSQNQIQKLSITERPEQLWSWGNLIVDGMEEVIFSLDRDWRFAYLNERAAVVFGRSKEDLLGKVVWEEFPTLLGSSFEKLYRQAMTDNIPGVLEDYSPTVQAWFEVRAYPIPQGLIIYFKNITERKLVDQELRQSEERYRLLAENSADLIFKSAIDGILQYVSPVCHNLVGYEPKELVGRSMYDFLHPDDIDLLKNTLRDLLKVPSTFTAVYRFLHKDGHYVCLESSGKVVDPTSDQPLYIVGTSRNINKRKQAEEALQASEERLRRSIQEAPFPLMIRTEDGEIIQMNNAWTEITGYSLADIPTIDKWIEKAYPQQQINLLSDLKQTDELTKKFHFGEQIVRTSSGEQMIWDFSAAPIGKGADGRRQMIIMAADITEHKHLQTVQEQSIRAIEEMRQFLQNTLDVLPSPIAVLDSDGIVLNVNAAWRRFGQENGAAPDTEDIGGNYLRVCDAATGPFSGEAEIAASGIRAVISGERAEFYLEYPCHSPTEKRWFLMLVAPFDEPAPRRVTMSHTDITKRKLAEEALRQSEARYRQAFELHGLPEIIIDPATGAIVEANPAASKYYGYPLETFNTMRITDITLAPPEKVIETLEKALAREVTSSTFLQRLASGEVREFEVFTGPLEDEGRPLLHSIFVDITARKQAETALQEANVTLEVKVLERTAELERVKNRLEAIFNNSGDGIVLLDLQHGIQQTNYAFDKMFRSTPVTTSGFSFLALVDPIFVSRLEDVIQKVVQTHKAQQIELLAQPFHNETSFDAEISISPVNFSDKAITSLVCIVRDVSERKRNQQQIAEERNLLRTLIDAVPDYIYVKDAQHRMVLNNVAHARSLQAQTPGRTIGKTDFELFPPELATKFHADDDEEIFRTGQPLLNSEERSVGQDGNSIWALTTKVPLRNLNSEIIGLVGITHDVTKLKQQEETLERNRADLKLIIESSELAFVLLDLEGNIRVFNQLAQEYQQELYGSKLKYGQSMLEYIPAEDHSIFLDRLTQVRSGETLNFVNEIKIKDIFLYFEFRYYPVKSVAGKIIGINIAYEDITQRKQTEHQLRFLASLQENMLDAVIATDIQFNIQSWNNAAERIYGWSKEEAVGKSIFGLIKSHLASGETQEESLKVLTEKGYWSGEALQNRRDASSVYIFLSVALLKDNEGKPTGFVALNRDITEQKKAEEGRLALTQRLELATFAAGIGIWDWNLKDNGLVWDNQMFALYGLRTEDFSGTIDNWERHVHPQDFPRLQAEIAAAVRGEKPYFTEFRVIWPNGSIHHIKTFGLIVYDKEGEPERMIGVNLDITNQKLNEETLGLALQQEKELSELKTRFVSVASHEFRTPLATILAATENLLAYREKMDGSQIDKRLDKIRGQVGHLKLIMEDVLTLSRIQAGYLEFNPVETDLDWLCRDIIEEFESSADIQHRILYSCIPQPLITRIDLKLMRQIVSNLLSNALKYSPEGKSVQFEVSVQGKEFRIQVKDEGIGIPKEDLKHLFEPFHRAANVGTISGTGLGLTIAKQSVETHGGTLEVESEIGVGTIFTVSIPLLGLGLPAVLEGHSR